MKLKAKRLTVREREARRVTRAKTPLGIIKAAVRRMRAIPEGYNQGTWAAEWDDPWFSDDTIRRPPCGTVCCIAGEVCAVLGKNPRKIHPMNMATRILKLKRSQRNDLFSDENMPTKARVGSAAYAEAGIKKITDFARRTWGYTGPDL